MEVDLPAWNSVTQAKTVATAIRVDLIARSVTEKVPRVVEYQTRVRNEVVEEPVDPVGTVY